MDKYIRVGLWRSVWSLWRKVWDSEGRCGTLKVSVGPKEEGVGLWMSVWPLWRKVWVSDGQFGPYGGRCGSLKVSVIPMEEDVGLWRKVWVSEGQCGSLKVSGAPMEEGVGLWRSVWPLEGDVGSWCLGCWNSGEWCCCWLIVLGFVGNTVIKPHYFLPQVLAFSIVDGGSLRAPDIQLEGHVALVPSPGCSTDLVYNLSQKRCVVDNTRRKYYACRKVYWNTDTQQSQICTWYRINK